jgi:threonine aldolase
LCQPSNNLCAILSHRQRGDEAIVRQMAHAYRREGGGAAESAAPAFEPSATALGWPWLIPKRPSSLTMRTARIPFAALENTLGQLLLAHV